MSQIPPAITYSFAITGCKCTKFSFTEFALNNNQKIDHDKYQFTVTVRLDVLKDKIDTVSVNVNSILFKLEGDKNVIANLESEHEFRVVNLQSLITQTSEGLMIPDAMLIQFFSISISAVRGMYSIKLSDSIYNNAVLPVFDAAQFIPRKASNIG